MPQLGEMVLVLDRCNTEKLWLWHQVLRFLWASNLPDFLEASQCKPAGQFSVSPVLQASPKVSHWPGEGKSDGKPVPSAAIWRNERSRSGETKLLYQRTL
jgi:hypothetical protein